MKQVVRSIVIILISVFVGFVLLVASYMFPSDVIIENIGRGMEPMMLQGSAYWYAVDYTETILDNQTDALMLSEAAFPSDNHLQDAVNVPHYVLNDTGLQLYSLMGMVNGDDLNDGTVDIYPRYWHGYVSILRPFFSIFDYSDWKVFNQAIQLVIIALLLVLMVKKELTEALIGFIPMLIIWNPATIGVSLQYAACFYISMIGSLLILLLADKRKINYLSFFLVLGILTAYLDYLTYPIVTLFLPLIFLILMREKSGNALLIKETVFIGVNWVAGYLGMWASKWILGSFITGENVIADATTTILSRTSSDIEGEKITRIGTVYKLINATFFKWPYVIMCVVVVALSIYMAFGLKKGREKQMAISIQSVIQLVIIGFMPFLWFFITANHANVHPRLVYRSLGITVFALSVALMLLLKVFAKKEKK